MNKKISIFSIVIILGLVTLLVGAIAARLIFNFEFSSFEIAILSLIVLVVIKNEIADFFEVIKIGGIELVTRVQKIERNLRSYAIVGPEKQIIHSTFDKDQFQLINYDPMDLKIKFKLNPQPSYLEVRSNQGSTFAIEYIDGVYTCTANGYISSQYNKVIIEAYQKKFSNINSDTSN